MTKTNCDRSLIGLKLRLPEKRFLMILFTVLCLALRHAFLTEIRLGDLTGSSDKYKAF